MLSLQKIQKFVSRITGLFIYRTPRRGWELGFDFKRHFPNYTPAVIFDVGANQGQSAAAFLDWFPATSIECFEPASSTAEKLTNLFAKTPNVRVHQLAMSDAPGEAKFAVHEDSTRSTLESCLTENAENQDRQSESVTVETVDRMREQLGIEKIDFLKVDVEGADLLVLRGADESLTNHQIDFVQVEAGMNKHNTTHVPFLDLNKFLDDRGYLLFGIYEQKYEWVASEPQLRRADLVYLSPIIRERFKQDHL